MSLPARRSDGGSVTVILAVSLTFFFALAALAVDIGFLYLSQRRAQAVADAASLAAAKKYADSSATTTQIGNAVTAILTSNGYPSGSGVTSYPSGTLVKVTLTTPTQNMFFGKIFGLASKSMTVTSTATSGDPIPAIWSGGGCGLTTGLQMNGGPFNINGNLVSYGPLNFFTSGGTVTGDLTNSNASPCVPPAKGATAVTGSISSEVPSDLPPDPFGYNMMTDFPACTAGDLTTAIVPPAMYNVPNVAGVVADGVYCANGNVNLSAGGIITAAHLTILATGYITVSSSGLDITGAYAGAHDIVFFSNYSTPDCNTQAINLGFPGGTLDGNVYAPNGCFQISGGGYTLNGSIVANEVQYGAGSSWTINAPTGGSDGKIALYQ